ncbi:hypothetical protein [Halalkalibacter krulwichiae]|uniref:Uncharacterized protein n=1 Tax=Halalkalibacter krulwichiae TaxID=199441 RepID=A0A1X9MI82_9BACI|nr:hypothetical protein [Halalkalibacter krulwichiae]ARK30262.1 hypothetical protein BkAM31D_10735 [Halalkalibacter krulwichiae]
MAIVQVNTNTELFQWLNEQTDLNSTQVDLVDGFIFMLKKINLHRSIRLINNKTLHPRFWRSHDRTFGYELMKQKKRRVAHLYQFYVDVAFAEHLVETVNDHIALTEEGQRFLEKTCDEQLDLLFSYIW